MINAFVDRAPLNGFILERRRTISVTVTIVGTGLTGGKIKFVAKELIALPDLDDSRSKIIKTTPTQIVIDTDASNSQRIVARFDIGPLDTNALTVDTLYWGIQFETSGGVIPFNELQGILKIENDRVKTLV